MVSFRSSQRTRIGLISVLALAVCATLALSACSGTQASNSSKTVSFTDSCGRNVEVPEELTAVAPSGAMAQQVLMTFDPSILCGLTDPLTADEEKFFGLKSSDYKVFGAIYGTKGSFNKEEVAASGTQLIIDIGESKKGIVEDLDKIQESIGVPVIHLEATPETYDQVYTTLGKLFKNEKRGNELAQYCKKAVSDSQNAMSKVSDANRVRVAYLTDATHALANGSYHAAILEKVATNAVVVENVTSGGFGNEVSLEQLAVWNPDVLLVQDAELYQKLASDPAWSTFDAVAAGKYYLVPNIPYGWLNSPPSVNQVLGLQWLPLVLYPDLVQGDIKTVVTDYFETMYGYKLTDAEYAEMTQYSVPK